MKERIIIKYYFVMSELLEKELEVESNSPEKAEELIWDMYIVEEIILDYTDHVSTDIKRIYNYNN